MDKSQTTPTAPDSAIDALRGLSPSDRLLGLYGYGIEGCAQRNKEQVTAVLQELIGILNFDYGEIAKGFYRLYAFCLAKSQDGEFDQVAWILRDLHDTWAQAFQDAGARELAVLSSAGPGRLD
jgi:flagellin-specific chaperone FliS